MNRTTFLQFFEYTDKRLLLIYLNERDEIIPTVEFPPVLRKKSMVFLKKQPVAITMENIATDLTWTDLASSLLAQLTQLVGDVYLPLLENQKNHEKWPEVIAQDVTRHFHKLLSNVSITLGQTKVLQFYKQHMPLPIHRDKLIYPYHQTMRRPLLLLKQPAEIKPLFMHWSQWSWTGCAKLRFRNTISILHNLLQAVIKSDCDYLAHDPSHPGPLAIIQFWNSKCANLVSIQKQLYAEQSKKVARILELSQSSYRHAFHNIRKETQKGISL